MKNLSEFAKNRYGAIIADPPWRYGSPRAIVGNGGRGKEGADTRVQVDVEAHYNTMSLDEIRALPVEQCAAKDALLFMWVTNPFLADGAGVSVVRAWGFTPKTVLTWGKVKADGCTPSMSVGWWFRSASEHCIFAVRGKPKRPPGCPALPTWQPAKRGRHSAKPDFIHRYAEFAAPEGPYLEMFARNLKEGWDTWGNEV